jgi:hypothetical protein
MPYDISAIRDKLRKQMPGKVKDPDEFRPPKANDGETLKFRFFILPPIMAGDKLKTGVAERSMDNFFLTHGNHWINDKPHPCPRVWDGSYCEVCQTGFDLLKGEEDKEKRKAIVKAWMPSTSYLVNIYFPNSNVNPEDLRGKVKYYNASKTCFDIWVNTLQKDDLGDPDDPSAYGVFFDENSAFQFQLEITKGGINNSYTTSKFITNGGQPTPMMKDKANLSKLLEMRHDLFMRVEEPDAERMKKLARVMLDGDDIEDDGFDKSEVVQKPVAQKAAVKKPTVVESDEDDILVDEIPFEESTYDTKPSKPSKPAKAEQAKKPSPAASSDDENDDELDALLDQLNDD